jgi:FMN phosphatase YigB (HAD superfamily)
MEKTKKTNQKTVIYDMQNTVYRFNPAAEATDELPIQEIPGALEKLINYYHQDYQIVIISRNPVSYSERILRKLLENYPEDADELINNLKILTMQDFGSKRDTKAWQKALRSFKNITHIYEDVPEFLAAADKAAKELGHQPKLHHVKK